MRRDDLETNPVTFALYEDENFTSQTPAQRCITVARDTLLLLKGRVIDPGRDVPWVRPRAYAMVSRAHELPPDTLLGAYLTGDTTGGCRVCALGGLFVGALQSFGHLTAGAFAKPPTPPIPRCVVDFVHVHALLSEMFDDSEIVHIEAAFAPALLPVSAEQLWGTTVFKDDPRLHDARVWGAMAYLAREKHDRHTGAPVERKSDVLAALCNNIVRHNGTFQPLDVTFDFSLPSVVAGQTTLF